MSCTELLVSQPLPRRFSSSAGTGSACEFCPTGKYAPIEVVCTNDHSWEDTNGNRCDSWNGTGGVSPERLACSNAAVVAAMASPAGVSATTACCESCPDECDRSADTNPNCRISGVSECTDCAAGRWSIAPGETSCASCGAGRFSPGQQECTYCPAGQASAAEEAASCPACPAGKYQEASGQESCNVCEGGQ